MNFSCFSAFVLCEITLLVKVRPNILTKHSNSVALRGSTITQGLHKKRTNRKYTRRNQRSQGGLSTIASKEFLFPSTYKKKKSLSITFANPKEASRRCFVALLFDIVPCKTTFPRRLENKPQFPSVLDRNLERSSKVSLTVSQFARLLVFCLKTCK